VTTKAGRYGAGAAGLLLLVSLVGCTGRGTASSGSRPATPQQVLDKAVKRLRAVTTYQASIALSTRMRGKSDHLDGEVASRPKDRAVQFDIPYTIDDSAADDAGSTQILLGDRLYIKNYNLVEVVHKQWIGLAVSRLKPDDPVMLLVATMHQSDPLTQATMLTASKDVHAVGRETTGGKSTTRYQGTFVVAEALAKLDAPARAEEQVLHKPFGPTVNFDVWIDDQQLIRQLSLVNRDGTKRRLNATMAYSTFDTPVSITAPPPKDVKNLNDPKDIPA
jgi:hypothetical protein